MVTSEPRKWVNRQGIMKEKVELHKMDFLFTNVHFEVSLPGVSVLRVFLECPGFLLLTSSV